MSKELDKVFEILKVDALDESARTEVTKFLGDVVEFKAKEKAVELSKEVIAEKAEQLSEEYATKFEDYKEEVFSKWSEFTDTIIAEEVQIPENVKEFAALGEMYKPLLDAIRTQLAVSEGSVDEEAKSLLTEAKDEIISLRSEINKLIKENVELKEDAKSMAVHIYLRKKCDGLTEAQRTKVMALLEDVTDVKQINEKFDFIVENLLEGKKKDLKDDDDDDDYDVDKKGKVGNDKDSKEEMDPDQDRDDDSDTKDGKKKSKKSKKSDDKDGKGKEGLDESSEEELSDWDKLMESYKSTLKTLP